MAKRYYLFGHEATPPFANDYSFYESSIWRMTGATCLANVAPGDSWALSMWIKTSVAFATELPFLTMVSTPGAGYWRLRFAPTYIYFDHLVQFGGNLRNRIITSYGINDNTWHHVAVIANSYTYDFADVDLYIDGLAVGSKFTQITPASLPWSATGDAEILASSKSGEIYLDEWAFFDYAPAIADLYNGGTPGNLDLLPTSPLNWLRGENNLTDSGTLADTITPVSVNPPIYSTDVP